MRTVNNRRTKKFFRIILVQLLVASVMFSLGVVIVFIAHGYRLNFKNFKVIKTGIVYLVSNQKSADVYINNRLASRKLPFSANLLPGRYQIEIKKYDYQTWSNTVGVEPELVADFKNIVLFKKEAVISDLADQDKIRLLSLPNNQLAVHRDDELLFNDYEIWVGSALITRFSLPIHNAVWYADSSHIVYQQKNQIRVIEKSGSNDTLLVVMAQDIATPLAIGAKGDEIYYIDEGGYKVAQVR